MAHINQESNFFQCVRHTFWEKLCMRGPEEVIDGVVLEREVFIEEGIY